MFDCTIALRIVLKLPTRSERRSAFCFRLPGAAVTASAKHTPFTTGDA